MTMRVACFASYLTTGGQWRNKDYCALFFVKAAKGKDFKGYGHVPVRGQYRYLASSNKTDAVTWFGWMAADYLLAQRINKSASFALVPLPSREGIIGQTFTRFPALALANALEIELKKQGVTQIVVADLLRWRERVLSAHDEGGPREPEILYPKLQLIGTPKSGVHHILVDDVCTSGGHILAAAARLARGGAKVWRAVCAGKTQLFPPDDPFEVHTEEYELYTPPGSK